MTIRLARIAITLLVSGAFTTASGGDALAALQAQFGTDIEYHATRFPEIRYCPDNTCESFRGARGANETDVADFALLYLWGVSQYVDLEPWQRSPVPAAVDATLRRRASQCQSRTPRTQLACTLSALAKSAGITVAFVRYDEGAVAEVKLHLEQELKRLK